MPVQANKSLPNALKSSKAQNMSSGETPEIENVQQEIASLTDHLRVLVQVVDELRDEIEYLNRNGLPVRDEFRAVHHVRQMAVDPCAEDWSERLVVDSRSSNSTAESKDAAGEPPAPGFQRDLF